MRTSQVIDIKYLCSKNPIISPGGYLRGMTRAFQQSQLNLMESLIGLSERRRTEQAP